MDQGLSNDQERKLLLSSRSLGDTVYPNLIVTVCEYSDHIKGPKQILVLRNLLGISVWIFKKAAKRTLTKNEVLEIVKNVPLGCMVSQAVESLHLKAMRIHVWGIRLNSNPCTAG